MRAFCLTLAAACLIACADRGGTSRNDPVTALPAPKQAAKELPKPDWRTTKLANARPHRPELEARRAAAERIDRPRGHAAIRFADLMTLAAHMVPKDEQRRWRELRMKVARSASGAATLAAFDTADRRAFAAIVEDLESANGANPVVTELVRRSR